MQRYSFDSVKNTITELYTTYSKLIHLVGYMSVYMIVRIVLADRTSLTSICIDLVAAYLIVFGIWYIRNKSRYSHTLLKYDFLAKRFPFIVRYIPAAMLAAGLFLHVHKLTIPVLVVFFILYLERLVSFVGYERVGFVRRVIRLCTGKVVGKIVAIENLYVVVLSAAALLLIALK